MRILRRTFTALQYPKGSEARTQLNASWITSEYMPSHRYGLVNDDGSRLPYTYRTKTEAEQRLSHNSGRETRP